jgi:hypothetical protein
MIFNHVANRLDPRYFETVVEMLKVKLGFIELRRTERAIWLRQPGANVDLQFSRSAVTHRDEEKLRSQVSLSSARLCTLGSEAERLRHACETIRRDFAHILGLRRPTIIVAEP